MRLREIRRRLTPHWLRTDARRQWRNVVFRRFGIERCYTPPIITAKPQLLARSWLPFVVAHELLNKPDMTFLQIGAFDGEADDDLHDLIVKHALRGVLVEPQPAAFARLQKTYRDQPQVTLLQAAISDRDGVCDFYCRRGEASMAASFDPNHLRRHGIPDDQIVRQQVACRTAHSALRVAGLERVDLIQIDAEGCDWPIIRSIDFTRIRPAILRFEYRHMRASEADACLELLAGHGYRFLLEPRDIIAHYAGSTESAATVSRRQSA
jgi:FkbM family methyltransferase